MRTAFTERDAFEGPGNGSATCTQISKDEILISRTTLIITLTISTTLTLASLVLPGVLGYRHFARKRQTRKARTWGRRSIWDNRISRMKADIDSDFSRQYSGCLIPPDVVENPEMGSDSPVEIGWGPERVWEVPAVPARAATEKQTEKRRSKMSLWFDEGSGLWMQKR